LVPRLLAQFFQFASERNARRGFNPAQGLVHRFVGGGDGQLGFEDAGTGFGCLMPVFREIEAGVKRRHDFLKRCGKPIAQGGTLHVRDFFLGCPSRQTFFLSGQRDIDRMGESGCQCSVGCGGFNELLMIGFDGCDLPSHRLRMPPQAAHDFVHLLAGRWCADHLVQAPHKPGADLLGALKAGLVLPDQQQNAAHGEGGIDQEEEHGYAPFPCCSLGGISSRCSSSRSSRRDFSSSVASGSGGSLGMLSIPSRGFCSRRLVIICCRAAMTRNATTAINSHRIMPILLWLGAYLLRPMSGVRGEQ
jgi:hypothetical protein